MDREQIEKEVMTFLSMRYFKEVEASDEDMAHFIAIMTECAEFVLGKYIVNNT